MKDHSHQLTLTAAGSKADQLTDYDWTFDRADTQYYTHGIHKYPARMPPQIPASLLNYYEAQGVIEPESVVYDPFSGSGTTSVEARVNGHHAIANDVNPFACLLTAAKAVPLDAHGLERATTKLFDGLQSVFDDLEEESTNPEEVLSDASIEAAQEVGTEWFPQSKLYQLLYTREKLDRLADEFDISVIRFLRICLAKASRVVSYQRLGEFKRYRMSESDRASHRKNVHKELLDATEENISKMKEYSRHVDSSLDTTVFRGDSRHALETDSPVSENSADIVITSPPYGDHRTTVAYGQFSTNLSVIAEGREFSEMFSVDDQGLGGQHSSSVTTNDLTDWSSSLDDTIQALERVEGRSRDALSFFEDYVQVIKEVSKIAKPGQPVAWVVACRRMSDELIPMHAITRELCEHVGYEFEAELPRYIRDKTLPHRNRQGQTMAEEYIVVMRSPE